MHRQRPTNWWRVMSLAREAYKRCRWHAHVDKYDRARWLPKDQTFKGYRPKMKEWFVLYTVAEHGRAQSGDLTVPGATVQSLTVKRLVRLGLVVKKDGWVYLTPEGQERVDRGW